MIVIFFFLVLQYQIKKITEYLFSFPKKPKLTHSHLNNQSTNPRKHNFNLLCFFYISNFQQ